MTHAIAKAHGQFSRLDGAERAFVRLSIDGVQVDVLEGDTILTAILTHQRTLRNFEFSKDKRSGFCLMGACQDCWVHMDDGARLRACTSFVEDGMAIHTGKCG